MRPVRSSPLLMVVLMVLAAASAVGACSSSDDAPPAIRIDGPAQVDPEYRDEVEGGG